MDPRASPGSITRARTGAHRQGKGGAARGQEEGYEGGKMYPPSTIHHPPSQCVASCCAAGNLWALGFDETDSLGFDDTDRATFFFFLFCIRAKAMENLCPRRPPHPFRRNQFGRPVKGGLNRARESTCPNPIATPLRGRGELLETGALAIYSSSLWTFDALKGIETSHVQPLCSSPSAQKIAAQHAQIVR